MTTLGKVLVLLHIAFSGVMLAWAVNLYGHRIDWTDTAASADKPGGELFVRRSQFDELQKNALPAALARWNQARDELRPLEARRAGDRAFYQAEMDHLRVGATAVKPARAPKLDKGRLILDKDGRPDVTTLVNDRRGNPLHSYNYYFVEEAKAFDVLNKVLEDYKAAIEMDAQLTERMLGPQGYQQQMVDERNKQNDLIQEEEAIRPLLLNAVVESELLSKRQQRMEARIQELRTEGKGQR
jgi:hypothetical protein